MVDSAQYRAAAGDVGWDGAVNARRIIGATYRMGRREWVTAQGWEQMRRAGVRRVLDLRNPGENRSRPADPRLPEGATAGIEVLNLPLERAGNRRFEKVAVPYMNHPAMYRLVCEEFPDLMREVFAELSASTGGVVVHCSAGRDRSGLVASLLLDLSGYSEQILPQDEAATRGINEWHRVSGYRHPHESYQTPGELEPVIADRARALEEFMGWLGGARGFLQGIGVSADELHALRGTVLAVGR